LGEAPKAFVVLKDLSLKDKIKEELALFLREKLAAYKIPKYFEFRESLPKNRSGKIQKLKLIEQEKTKQNTESRNA
ncbi:MAG: acyl--CoA ligase, partial [Calditrichaeota bacterium]|nr:acyl--CoA ligase [Calditrichota bacterium]